MRIRRKYHSTPLLAPMIDLFVLNLVLLLLNRPVFGINESTLPMLQVVEPSASPAGTADGAQRLEACLRHDGSVQWNKETVPIAQLVERIARETTAQQKVALIVEIGSEGQGAIQNLLQFQMDAGRLGIGPRLRILRRPINKDGAAAAAPQREAS